MIISPNTAAIDMLIFLNITFSSIQFIKLMANCTFNITLFYSTIMQCSILFYDTVLVFLHFNGDNIS
jgi:hypothetical protein